MTPTGNEMADTEAISRELRAMNAVQKISPAALSTTTQHLFLASVPASTYYPNAVARSTYTPKGTNDIASIYGGADDIGDYGNSYVFFEITEPGQPMSAIVAAQPASGAVGATTNIHIAWSSMTGGVGEIHNA